MHWMEVAVMGPRAVLAAVPLNITGKKTDYEFKPPWPLPVLRENIRHIELALFSEYFLHLAARCLTRSQICSLLPGFCNCPTDIATSLKSMARTLGCSWAQGRR